jgi:hypothetical protein
MKQNYDATYANMVDGWQNPEKAAQANVSFQQVLDQMATVQQSAGLTKAEVAVLPKDTAIQMANQLQNLPNDEAVTMLGKMSDSYGDWWPNAVRDMTKHGNLNAQFVAMSAFQNSPYEGTILNALRLETPQKGQDSLNKMLGMEGENNQALTSLKNTVTNGMQDYLSAVAWGPGGLTGASQITDLVSSVAKYHMTPAGGNMSPETAASSAVNEVINSQFNFGDMKSRKFLIPKSEVPDGQEGEVQDGAKAMMPWIARGAIMNPDIGAFFGKKDGDLTQGDRDEFNQAIQRYGTFVNTPDGKSLRLVVDQQKAMAALSPKSPIYNNVAGTGLAMVTSGGKPIDIPFSGIRAFNTWNSQNPDKKAYPYVPPFASPGYNFQEDDFTLSQTQAPLSGDLGL